MRTREFKDTELGPIPKDWDVRRIGECCDIQLGKMLDAGRNVGELKYYVSNRDVHWGNVDVSDLHMVRMTNDDLAKYDLVDGDLLVCEGGEVGRAAIWNAPIEECYFQKTLHRLRSKKSHPVSLDYLQKLLHRYSAIGMLDDFVVKTSIAHLTKEKFATVPFAFPSLPEQRRIAAALGDVDKLIENLKKRVEKKKNLKRGAMQELLTGKRRLKGFTGAWVEKRLGAMLTIGNGRDYKHLGAGDVPVYGTGGLMTYVDDFLFEGATVCFGRKGTIDEPQYHEGKIWTVDTLYFTYDFIDTDPKWLYYRSLLIDWLSYNTASGVPSLTAKAICGITVSVPPLPEQRAIAAVLSDMDAEIANLEHKLKKMTLLKQGMMQDLLTGKVRLT